MTEFEPRLLQASQPSSTTASAFSAGAPPEEAAAAIASYGAALEIVDLAPVPGEPEAVVARNLFHRAVSLMPLADHAPAGLETRITVNGALRGAAPWPHDLSVRLAQAARLLAAVGESMRAGDQIITGSIVQVPIGVGDVVVASFGDLAAVRLTVESG